MCVLKPSIHFLKRYYLFIFREGEGREKERERNIDVQETSVASHTPPTGNLAHNPGMSPTGNRTGNLSIRRMALNLLSHTSQGHQFIY